MAAVLLRKEEYNNIKKELKLARYTGPTNKLYRNFGVKDLSNRKLTSSMRQNSSGQHGAMRKKSL